MTNKVKHKKSTNNSPSDWQYKALGELFDFKNGINASKESYGKGVKFINVMEIIYNDSITSEMIPGSVQINNDQKELYSVKHGDVLFNRTSETTNEIGLTSVYYGNSEVVFGGFVIRGRPLDRSVDDEFKKYCFRSKIVRDQIVKSGQGVVRSNIGQGDLEKVRVLLPPKKEQKAIASLLSVWDKTISKTELLLQLKEKQKKWLMRSLLNGRTRLKGHTNKWTSVKFKDIYSQIREKAEDKKYLVLSVTKNGIVSQADYFKKEIASEDTSPYLVMKKGDMVFSGLNFWMGAIDVLTEYDYGMVSPAYKVFEIHNKNISAEFMKFYVRSENMIKALVGASVVGASIVRRNLDREILDEWSFKLPSKEEQKAISLVLKSASKEIEILKKRIRLLKIQKKELMQQLLTGKKRLKV